jgi:hypothetical protein
MAELDVSTLENIFRMITPADLLGAQKLAIAQKVEDTTLRDLQKIIFGEVGAQNVEQMCTALNDLAKKVPDGEAADQFKRIIRFYKTGDQCTAFGDAPFMAMGNDGKTPTDKITFDELVGPNVQLAAKPSKSMGVILCNSNFLSPAVRNAERVETFLNYMPSLIASRMVPLLEVEFEFNRGLPEPKDSQPHMWAPGLLKFLLGGDQTAIADAESPTKKMLDLRETHSKDNTRLHSTAGMEMFTSPQLLVNPAPNAAAANRYVDVLDPFRPLMSIESFSVNVSPTVGLFSYKKATLVFKLHDRSRLNEIADLVRPQVYQDKSSAPTVWVTYGWRHPAEPGNPYAEFINGHMLVREAYGIINTQFSFDQVGQVTLTMSLWTRGLPEMRTLHVNDDGALQVVKDIRDITAKINKYRLALGIGTSEGVNKEVRGFMILEAAERGTLPDMSKKEIKDALDALKASLSAPGAKLDRAAADSLISELGKLYKESYLDYKKTLQEQATSKTRERFAEVMGGVDPFLPFSAKDARAAAESKAENHPLTKLVERINEYTGQAEVKQQQNPTDKRPPSFQKKVASFGKLVSVFTANTLKQLDAVDEMQIFFYQFNDKAGDLAGVNIADFPVEMPVFLDQYRQHVERKGSERVTLEEFLRLVVDAQLHDIRAIGYGFRKFYAPYDPTSPTPTYAKGLKPEEVELAKGPFQMPVIDVYAETMYALSPPGDGAAQVADLDKLHQFEIVPLVQGGPNLGRASHYTRIMRVHIFDKTNNPYKLADAILQADDGVNFVPVEKSVVKQTVVDKGKEATKWQTVMKILTPDAKIDRNKDGKIGPSEVKGYVASMVPTIIYGGNASSVISANLASKQDPLLATTQMQALAKGSKSQTLQTNGSDVGGLPLRIVPASMTMTTLGCPLLSYAQIFFIDFNTGTTIDNLYSLTGITHTITPGKFESQLTLTFADAYGKYFAAPSVVDYAKSIQQP